MWRLLTNPYAVWVDDFLKIGLCTGLAILMISFALFIKEPAPAPRVYRAVPTVTVAPPKPAGCITLDGAPEYYAAHPQAKPCVPQKQ